MLNCVKRLIWIKKRTYGRQFLRWGIRWKKRTDKLNKNSFFNVWMWNHSPSASSVVKRVRKFFKTAAKTLSSFFLPEVRVSDQQKAAAADPLWTMWEQQAIWTSSRFLPQTRFKHVGKWLKVTYHAGSVGFFPSQLLLWRSDSGFLFKKENFSVY